MTQFGVDAEVPIPIEGLDGYDFVFRYACDPANAAKCATKAEVDAYRAAGKGVGLYYEDEAHDALGGAPVGLEKAKLAAVTLNRISWPRGLPVHFACDFSVVGSEPETCFECITAFNQALGLPMSVYGDVNACDFFAARGVRYLVQFGEGISAKRTVYQGYAPSLTAGGVPVDPLTAYAADFGAWFPTESREEDVLLAKFPDGQSVLLIFAEKGFIPVGPEWWGWLSAQGVPVAKDVLPHALAKNLKNLGPFTSKGLLGRALSHFVRAA